MLRTVASLAIPIAFLLLAGVSADQSDLLKTQADDTSRGGHGGQGHSQQYHYSSHPSHDGYTYAGLSFDLSTGLFLALGAIIVLLALAAVCYPLLSSKGGGQGWGWDAGASSGGGASNSYGGWSRSYNFAGTAEKVLTAVEKLYDAYGKSQ